MDIVLSNTTQIFSNSRDRTLINYNMLAKRQLLDAVHISLTALTRGTLTSLVKDHNSM